jgi:type VI secretion system VasD/TssJ family lipoprotein
MFFANSAFSSTRMTSGFSGTYPLKFIKTAFPLFAGAGLLAAALGCKGPSGPGAPPPAARFQVRAAASPGINRGPDGTPLSVVVRVYQLKDRTAFAKLTFDLAASGRPDAELLAGEALGRDELVVVPGQDRTSRHDLLPGTRYIGLVGLFRDPEARAWRALAHLERMAPPPAPGPRDWPWRPWRRRPAPAPAPAALAFRVREAALALEAPGPEPLPEPGAGPAPAEERP